jgi:transposase InsO family protein
MKGKMTQKSFKHHFDPTSAALEVVHGDLVGPITPSSNGGARYFLTLVDQHTGYINITILKEKSDAPDAINKFKIFYENQTGNRMKKLITDGGGEFCNKNLSSLLEAAGVQHNVSPPYTPQQNGVAERANRTILDMTQCILLHSNLAPE